MYLKLFSPVLFLLIFQLIAFFFYNGFLYAASDYAVLMVSLTYISAIFAIFCFCFCSSFIEKKNEIVLTHVKNRKVEIFFLILTIIFIVKPTFIMFMLGLDYGFDYVRQNYFSTDIIKSLAFGNMTIAVLTNLYLVQFLWFYIFLIIGSNDKFTNFVFYFILLSLVVFNLSYAGRFYIYFAFLVLFLKSLLEREKILVFLKKYSILFLGLIFSAFSMVNLRSNKNVLENDSSSILKLLEYHVMQPYFFAQKIDDYLLWDDGYPFRVIFESLNAHFLYLFGVSFSETTFGYYSAAFGNPTLYSQYSFGYYNAFSTFFAYIYADSKIFTPIITFIILLYLMLSSFFIWNLEFRRKFLAYISLMLYFSLFQAPIFTPGFLLIGVFVPLYFLAVSKFKKVFK